MIPKMKPYCKNNIYQRMQSFAALTKTLWVMGNMPRVARCLLLAEKRFLSGNAEMRNAISNVYLYSVSAFMEQNRCRASVLLPPALQAAYFRQINTSSL